jgi:N-methylhydantoinase A/oxoprolinase/acetone carboxylase beta subunit
VLADREPQAAKRIKRLLKERPEVPEELDFFALVRQPDDMQLKEREAKIVEMLQGGAHSRRALSEGSGALVPELLSSGRLEQAGVIRLASVTPTDALHVLGEFTGFDEEIARLAVDALASILGMDPDETAELIKTRFELRLAEFIMERQLQADGHPGLDADCDGCGEFIDYMLDENDEGPWRIQWQQKRAVIGIGAPVHAYLPGACRRLGAEAVLPPHAEVANAVGAVTGEVTVTERVSVRPGEFSAYVMHSRRQRREFADLGEAEEAARDHVVDLVRERARRFGTEERHVDVEVRERKGHLNDGSEQLLELVVDGYLTGAPALSASTEASS